MRQRWIACIFVGIIVCATSMSVIQAETTTEMLERVTQIKNEVESALKERGVDSVRVWNGLEGPLHMQVGGLTTNGLDYLVKMKHPVELLVLEGSHVDDFGTLKTMPLKKLFFWNVHIKTFETLRGLDVEFLQVRVNGMRETEYEDEEDFLEFVRPMTKLTGLYLDCIGVKDLSPLRNKHLESITLDVSKVSDLKSLQGMPLKELVLSESPVSDLSVVRGMPLEYLDITRTMVTNIAILKGLPLKRLKISRTRIEDLSVLVDRDLQELCIDGTDVDDISALKGMGIERLTFSPDHIKNWKSVFETLTKLKWVSTNYAEYGELPVEFVKRLEKEKNVPASAASTDGKATDHDSQH